jgi:hypothetical protein
VETKKNQFHGKFTEEMMFASGITGEPAFHQVNGSERHGEGTRWQSVLL